MKVAAACQPPVSCENRQILLSVCSGSFCLLEITSLEHFVWSFKGLSSALLCADLQYSTVGGEVIRHFFFFCPTQGKTQTWSEVTKGIWRSIITSLNITWHRYFVLIILHQKLGLCFSIVCFNLLEWRRFKTRHSQIDRFPISSKRQGQIEHSPRNSSEIRQTIWKCNYHAALQKPCEELFIAWILNGWEYSYGLVVTFVSLQSFISDTDGVL